MIAASNNSHRVAVKCKGKMSMGKCALLYPLLFRGGGFTGDKMVSLLPRVLGSRPHPFVFAC